MNITLLINLLSIQNLYWDSVDFLLTMANYVWLLIIIWWISFAIIKTIVDIWTGWSQSENFLSDF